MAYRAPQPNDDNSAQLKIIVILLAVIAACAVVGAGIWLVSWWQTQRAIDAVVGDTVSGPDLTGTWTRPATKDEQREVELRITEDNPVSGNITVDFTEEGFTCTATWSETNREYSTIYVDANVTSGNCFDNEWKLSLDGNTLTAIMTWPEDAEPGSTLVLHRESS